MHVCIMCTLPRVCPACCTQCFMDHRCVGLARCDRSPFNFRMGYTAISMPLTLGSWHLWPCPRHPRSDSEVHPVGSHPNECMHLCWRPMMSASQCVRAWCWMARGLLLPALHACMCACAYTPRAAHAQHPHPHAQAHTTPLTAGSVSPVPSRCMYTSVRASIRVIASALCQ